MENDPVVLALRAALASRDSVALRVGLGKHLLAKGRAADALAEFEGAFAVDAGSREALEGAVAAAEAAGDAGKATAYRHALEAPAGAKPPAAVNEILADAPESRGKLRLVADGGATLEGAAEEEAEVVLRFADVGGMIEVKARLERSFLAPVRNPEMFKKFGKKVGGGLVLYGPPGCGKTYLARATAGEIGARFVNIALSDILDMYFGESERRLHEIFENARRRAPTLVFFDEVDGVGQRRANLKGYEMSRKLVTQLLTELDGFAARNEGVFFLAATNHPWDIDPALRRPGRFDRMVFVPPPDGAARKQILELKLRGRPLAEKLDLAKLAKTTDGFSGADLEGLVETATELAIERSMRDGKETPIDDDVLVKAFRDMRASTRPWFETARNYAIYANEGGTYDDLLLHLKSIGLA